MVHAIWRLEALETPAWSRLCGPCGRTRDHRSTQRFRVNANGARHDIWLLYRCSGCDTTRKRRLFRRSLHSQLGKQGLHPYLINHPGLAWEHAFEVKSSRPLAYRIKRTPLPDLAELVVAIEQPYFCALRGIASSLPNSHGVEVA